MKDQPPLAPNKPLNTAQAPPATSTPAGLADWCSPTGSAPGWWAIGLTVLLLVGRTLPEAQFFASPAHYLPLHTGLEFISIAVSVMVFALAWNLRRQADNSHLMRLGVGFLAVSLIDFAHTLSYSGMPVWVTPSGPEKAINFWLSGRLMAALTLLSVAWQGVNHWSENTCRSAVLVAVLGSAVVWWVGLSHADILPRTFVAGQGLTPFKIASEVLLMGLYGLAGVLLFLKSRRSGNQELQWLAASAWVQGLAEIFFTLYVDVTDLFNLLGHVYKALAYLMVYRALFSAGVQTPFLKLQESQDRLRDLTEMLNETEQVGKVGGWALDLNTGVQTWTNQVYAIHEIEQPYMPTLDKGINFYTEASRPVIELAVKRAIEQQEPFNVELEITTAKGHRRSVNAIGKPDLGHHRLYGFFQDITERTRIEAEVRQLAFHDALTQLPNRRLLNDRLQQALAASQRSGRFGAVMLLDLDNFKAINDAHGHGAGDLLLKEVARRLLACVRASDTVARVGGDEFVVLITELKTDRAASILQAYAVAEKIRLSLAEPYHFTDPKSATGAPEITHRCTACIGLVMFIDHEASSEELLKWADAAMYKVKNTGRNAIHFHQAQAVEP